jgi:hypothetical protein
MSACERVSFASGHRENRRGSRNMPTVSQSGVKLKIHLCLQTQQAAGLLVNGLNSIFIAAV